MKANFIVDFTINITLLKCRRVETPKQKRSDSRLSAGWIAIRRYAPYRRGVNLIMGFTIKLIDGHSPIFLLQRALSRGVHELPDKECLELASTVRLVLGELSERLFTILKDQTELTEAISTLLPHKSI